MNAPFISYTCNTYHTYMVHSQRLDFPLLTVHGQAKLPGSTKGENFTTPPCRTRLFQYVPAKARDQSAIWPVLDKTGENLRNIIATSSRPIQLDNDVSQCDWGICDIPVEHGAARDDRARQRGEAGQVRGQQLADGILQGRKRRKEDEY